MKYTAPVWRYGYSRIKHRLVIDAEGRVTDTSLCGMERGPGIQGFWHTKLPRIGSAPSRPCALCEQRAQYEERQ